MEESEYLAMIVPTKLVAQALEVPPSTIYSWLHNGNIPAKRSLSGRWQVTVGACHALIEARARIVDKEEIRRKFDIAVQQYFATRREESVCA